MSIIFKKVFFKPTAEIEFHSDSASFLNHVKTTYIDTGKCLRFREKSYATDDLLVQVVESEWADQQGYDEFLIDPMSLNNKEEIIAYNKANGVMLIDIGPET